MITEMKRFMRENKLTSLKLGIDGSEFEIEIGRGRSRINSVFRRSKLISANVAEGLLKDMVADL